MTTPRLNRTDAWLLGAITDTRPGNPVSLSDFVNKADWINRLIPTYDDVRFSFPRLIAAGYLSLGRDRGGRVTVEATAAAHDLMSSVQADTLGGVLRQLAALVGARPYPEPEVDDRSLGPLDGFSEAEWKAAVDANASVMKRLIAGTGLLGLAIAAVAAIAARLGRSRGI